MRRILMPVLFVVAAFGALSQAVAQDESNTEDLASEIETLRKQVLLLEKENDLLKREIELLKREGQAEPQAPDDATPSDADPDEKPITKAKELGSVEYELIKCARSPKDKSKVVFTFAVRCDNGAVQTVHGCKELTLTLADGSVVEGEVAHVSNEMVMLTKGVTKKFQVTYAGVDKAIDSFEEVDLTMGAPLGIPRSPLQFYRIKILPK